MTKKLFILIISIELLGCEYTGTKNKVLKEQNNIAQNSKAILFFKDGNVSVTSYNISIQKDYYKISNSDTANIFSFTDCDTINTYMEKNIIRMVWTGKTELEIWYPEKGTVWKNDSLVNVDGINYHVRYRIK